MSSRPRRQHPPSPRSGANTDVPAGDIGVGGREIGYMFGQYKRVVGGAPRGWEGARGCSAAVEGGLRGV